MKKVLFSLHNGIGDIIMLFPYMCVLPPTEYEVTLETHYPNFELANYFLPRLKLKDVLVPNVYEDSRATVEGYDIFINLNREMFCNDLAFHFKDTDAMKLNQQILVGMLCILQNLPIPRELSPSVYFQKEKHPTNKVLIFTKSKHPNRSVSKKIVTEIEKICDNKYVFLNPRYDTLTELFDEINNANFVVTVDTGTLHLAEALSTKWLGLFTNMGGYTRTKYYKHGTYIQSNLLCSPCNHHCRWPSDEYDICKIDAQNEYACTSGFDVHSIINLIKENV